MEEIRIHGRGGQGVVTAAEIIAIAAFREGFEAQAFPNFGVERTGAPIESFVRIDGRPIITREQIYRPTLIIIQDSTLIGETDVFKGANTETLVIINSASNRWPKLSQRFSRLIFVPATEIALKILGKNIVNTVILGALARSGGLVSLTSLQAAIREKFAEKGRETIAKNLNAIKAAYES